MNDFAVVSEGFTDQPVLRRILLTYFKTPEMEPSIVFEQPRTDATGEHLQREFGNWLNVIKYLEERLYRGAFQTSRYLVVQIDSDCSEMPRYDVLQQEGGRSLTVRELIERIISRLRSVIGEDDLAAYAGRFVFAVCVREIECWLLPLWASENNKDKTTGCLRVLNRALQRQNQRPINPDHKDIRLYQNAAAGYKRRDVLLAEGGKNESLRIFLERLSACNAPLGNG